MKAPSLLLVTALALALVLVRSAEASPAHGPKIPQPWLALADCESGDGDGRPPYRPNWRVDGYFDGGLQFLPSTWAAATRLYRNGSRRYRFAYEAPPIVQVRVAQRWLRATSWEQWPACSRKLGLR